MALIKAKARQTTTVTRDVEGADVYLRSLRDGSLNVANLRSVLAMEGRVFCANAGTVTTSITCGAGDINTTEPDLWVQVPTGTTILPFECRVKMDAYGSNQIFELLISYGTSGSTTAPGSGTAVVPVNLRSDQPFKSNCTIYDAVDASGVTYPTLNIVELWRHGQQVAVTKATAVNNVANYQDETFVWSAVETGVQPVIIGPAQLGVYAASHTSKAFITFIYAELPSTVVQ